MGVSAWPVAPTAPAALTPVITSPQSGDHLAVIPWGGRLGLQRVLCLCCAGPCLASGDAHASAVSAALGLVVDTARSATD